MAIRILLADDHRIVRQGIRSLIEKNTDLEVVGETDDGRTAIRLCEELHPAVVVMDISMPGLNGIEATRRITTQGSDTKVIALSMHSNRRFVVDMLKAGAAGYLLKECLFDDLIRAIRAVVTGQRFLTPKIASLVLDDYLALLPEEGKSGSALSTREREVLQLLAEGNSTKEIAVKLNVSGKAVEAHRRQIMKKLDLHSVAELTKYALREGITSLEA
jgi:DNA-binding NarL/FixJ family response regulator